MFVCCVVEHAFRQFGVESSLIFSLIRNLLYPVCLNCFVSQINYNAVLLFVTLFLCTALWPYLCYRHQFCRLFMFRCQRGANLDDFIANAIRYSDSFLYVIQFFIVRSCMQCISRSVIMSYMASLRIATCLSVCPSVRLSVDCLFRAFLFITR